MLVRDKAQAAQAKQLIMEDQAQRAHQATPITPKDWLLGFVSHAKQNPVEFVFTLLGIAMILSLTLIPFWIGQHLGR